MSRASHHQAWTPVRGGGSSSLVRSAAEQVYQINMSAETRGNFRRRRRHSLYSSLLVGLLTLQNRKKNLGQISCNTMAPSRPLCMAAS
eukprot:g22121.t1